MNNTPNIHKLNEAIQAHPGKRAHDRWSNLELTFRGIYQANRKQLLDLMEAPNNNEKLLVELMQNVRPQTAREAYEYDLLKAFHNYIASSSSLVDHSRRFIKEYTSTDFSREYDERRKVIAATREHNFLKDIRNYVIHVDVPPLGWVISINENDEEHFEPFFNSGKLREWNNWSTSTKALLAEAEEEMKIRPIIATHGTMIDDFYNWIFAQFRTLHGKEIDEVNELIRQTRPAWLDKQSD